MTLLTLEGLRNRLNLAIQGQAPPEGWQKDAEDYIQRKQAQGQLGKVREAKDIIKKLYAFELGQYPILDKKMMRELKILSDADLDQYEPSEQVWIVPGLIPEKAITFFAGKRSSCKTWAALNLALALASGKPFLGSFSTIKSNVLFLDEESGQDALKERVDFLKSGMGITEPLDNLHYISFAGIKLDRPGWRESLEQVIRENEIKVIVVDSLRRIIAGEENDATTLNELFTEIVRPITEKYGCTWVFIHHMRKGAPDGRTKDVMDELRGSSEFANYADSIMTFKRKPRIDNKFIFRHVKSRRAKEHEPCMISMDWNESSDGFMSLTFTNEGTAEDVLDKIELAAKKIMEWMEENSITTSKTGEIKAAMSGDDFSGRTIERALDVLVGRGDLLKVSRGVYHKLGGNFEGKDEPPIRQHTFGGNGGKDILVKKTITRDTDNSAILYSKGGNGGNKTSANPAISIKVGGNGGKLENMRKIYGSGPFHKDFFDGHGIIGAEVEKALKMGLLFEESPGSFRFV